VSFEKFLARALQPPEDGEGRPGPDPAEAIQDRAPMTKVQFERHLIERMNALLEEADERKGLAIFANVVSWKLAVLGHHCGPGATGHIVRLLGGHLEHLVELERGQRESEAARKRGNLPS
jgi:hypothetical protein